MASTDQDSSMHNTRPLWANLNVFVGAFLLISNFGFGFLYGPVSAVARWVLPPQSAVAATMPLLYAIVAAALGLWWWKYGLSPAPSGKVHRLRLRLGHVLLGLCSIFMVPVLLPALAPGALAALPSGAQPLLRWLLPAFTLAPLLSAAGLFLVWSARSRAPAQQPAFADTQPEDGEARTRLASRKSAAPAVAGSLVGLVASSYLLFIAAIFLAVGMQGWSRQSMQVAAGAAGTLYVLYIAATVWLLVTGRRGAALWVAWAPIYLLLGGGQLSLLIAMLFQR